MPLRLSGLPAMIVPVTPSAYCSKPRIRPLRAVVDRADFAQPRSRPSDHRGSVGYLQSYRTPATGPANTLDKGERCILERGEAGEDSPSALSPLKWTGFLRSLSSAVAGAQIFNTAASSLGKGASANEFGHASLCCARLRFPPRGAITGAGALLQGRAGLSQFCRPVVRGR